MTFENWESEFLPIGSYVVLTAFLVQRGSPESKPAPEDEPGTGGEAAGTGAAPPPRPRWRQWLRDNGLLLAFAALFVGAFVGHLVGGAAAYNTEQAAHADRRYPPWSSWATASSGSSRCRTGRASSSRSACWSC